jgi:hypothetical protein
MRLALSATRVEEQSKDSANRAIQRATAQRLEYFRNHPQEIPARLRELDQEWDIERALETGSASLSLLGLVLGIGSSRKWLIIPLAVQAFFLQHALQGWCPPLPVFRSLGFRTVEEIDQERTALKALQGSRHFRRRNGHN